ncbi:MAG TPA: LysR family transcriptional regulator [Veillonellaceae bacterium]|uniref:LysR family transcriptional regulator n=1 Tax=Dialister hominis TaxID=2582419 RepID=UPI002660537D|nr:LysR family transcriptional regulator [uncultured Dialister sp.]HJI41780.1 LysR family transcriptional regulator [Veillonellaceae bacterium]
MEIRVLRYFLAVAQEGSVTRAARALHLTQPTLSRQIRELEEELGQTLFSRGGRELSLTREGLLLRQRAEEIVGLAEITEKEFRSLGEKTVSGDLSLGCGESKALSFVTDALKVLQDEHPLIIPHFFSGNGEIVMDRLDKGLLDFAVLMGAENTERYSSLPLPNHDTWGLLMDKDDPMAQKKAITAEDLLDIPLILSSQSLSRDELSGWLGFPMSRLHIAATYTLLFNGSLMVRSGLGYALCFDHIAPSGKDSPFAFRPLSPLLTSPLSLVWKKHQILSAPAEAFLAKIREAGEK